MLQTVFGRIVVGASWARPDYYFRLLFDARLAVLQQAGATAYASLGQVLGYIRPPGSPAAEADICETREYLARGEQELASPDATAARSRMLFAHDRRARPAAHHGADTRSGRTSFLPPTIRSCRSLTPAKSPNGSPAQSSATS